MEGDKTLGAEHTMELYYNRCYIIILYTWNLHKVINNATPINLIEKEISHGKIMSKCQDSDTLFFKR